MKSNFLTFFVVGLMLLTIQVKSQSILFNSSGGTPDASALMELQSTEQGILVPRMSAANRLAISSPAQGLLVFQTNGTIGFYYHNGTGWDTLGGATTVTNISNVTNASNSNIAVVRDEKNSGVDGGDFTSGSWITRDLSSLSGDVSFISLDTNAFALDSGTYVITASAPARKVDQHQIRLYNITDGSIHSVGTAVTAASASPPSTLITTVSVTAASNVFRIEHRCKTTRTSDGLGEGASWGTNVYTQIRIEKL